MVLSNPPLATNFGFLFESSNQAPSIMNSLLSSVKLTVTFTAPPPPPTDPSYTLSLDPQTHFGGGPSGRVVEKMDSHIVIKVELSDASDDDVIIDFEFVDGQTGRVGQDYGSAIETSLDQSVWTPSSRLTIPAGRMTSYIRTTLADDEILEEVEDFKLEADTVSGASTPGINFSHLIWVYGDINQDGAYDIEDFDRFPRLASSRLCLQALCRSG